MPPQPTPPQPPSPPQTVADIKAEREYQRLLAHRVRQQQLQKRLQEDLARLARPQVEAEQAMARSAPGRLRELEARRALAREELAVARQVREMDLRQRYGRVGGLLAGAERFGQSRVGQVLGAGATAFGAFAGNAARSGFSGTVEGNRLAFEWQLLNREFASAFKPVIELFTAGVSKVRRFMEGLDGAGQRMVMIAGLLAGAYGTLRVARTVGGAIGLAGAGGGAGSLLGLGGAGAAGAAALAGGAGGGSAPAGGAKGAPPAVAGGSRTGGALAGASKFGMYAGIAASGMEAYDAVGAARRSLAAKTPEEKKGVGADFLQTLKANGGPAAAFLDSGYAKRKLGEAGIDLDKPGRKSPRDQVTPDQFGYEEVGSAYKRASVGFLSQQAAGAEEASRKKAEEEAAGGGGLDSTAPAAMIERGFATLLDFLHGAVGQLTRQPVQ